MVVASKNGSRWAKKRLNAGEKEETLAIAINNKANRKKKQEEKG